VASGSPNGRRPVLLERELSVHLMLDADGTVYQALDLAIVSAYHAGPVNQRSVGVEICNPVRIERNKWCHPPRPVVDDPGVNGDQRKLRLDFYPIQKSRVVELAEAVSAAFGIPRALPRAADGSVMPAKLRDPSQFRGTCGHYHVSATKDDPGTTLWPGLSAAGWG
jgi:N-acetyl-anhydromuramyl-L-alanine amidase AmpD